MQDFSTPRTYILSAYRDWKASSPTSNQVNHADLSVDLANQGVPFLACEGTYKGKYEQSFIVTGAEHAFKVATLAALYHQETYLVVTEHDRTAYLVDVATGYHTHLGKFENVGTAQPADDWTYSSGYFFTTNGRPGVDLPGGI